MLFIIEVGVFLLICMGLFLFKKKSRNSTFLYAGVVITAVIMLSIVFTDHVDRTSIYILMFGTIVLSGFLANIIKLKKN